MCVEIFVFGFFFDVVLYNVCCVLTSSNALVKFVFFMIVFFKFDDVSMM